MTSYELKYGCNPHQKPARIYMEGGDLPVTVLNGRPGYINFLDALNAWQLVSELKKASGGLASAASFKHVSPSGVSYGLPLSDAEKAAFFVSDMPEIDKSPLACAYAAARGTDRMSSFGDFAALSDICDETTAKLLAREVSDGVIAPGYTDEALAILKEKRKGTYAVIAIDPAYEPDPREVKTVFGITFEQERSSAAITEDLLNNIVTADKDLPEAAKKDMLLALITLKYTQSNSVCFVRGGRTIGVGAGQQSRIHCTRLAASKADLWHLRQSPRVTGLQFADGLKRPEINNVIDTYLGDDPEEVIGDGIWQNYFKVRPEAFTAEEKAAYLKENARDVTVGSDAFFPFSDIIERSARSGVRYVVQPGGSLRDDLVIDSCNKHGMIMCLTGLRLFHH